MTEPAQLFNHAISLHRAGRLPEAEAAYREAIRWQPDFAAAHDHLANLLEAKGDADRARYEVPIVSPIIVTIPRSQDWSWSY